MEFERHFYMKIVATIIPTNLVKNLLSSLTLRFRRNQNLESNFQQVGGLIRRNIFVFCS